MTAPAAASPARTAAIIGAGPAGLMAAERLAGAGVAVTIYERMPSPARKFLMAGRGGLNLTHSEPRDTFMSRYGDAGDWLFSAIDGFAPNAVRAWVEDLGEPTFIGSSGRVFPQSFKASPLLRAWLRRLSDLGVKLETRSEWRGWNADGSLIMSGANGERAITADVTILATGGASWPRLGSDGAWVKPLATAGVDVTPLAPSNSGVTFAWSHFFRDKFAGEPLKRIALTCEGVTMRGESVITRDGMEGGVIYALSRQVRTALERDGAADIDLNLRPDVEHRELAARLEGPRGSKSGATWLRKNAGLPPVAVALLREADIREGVDSLALGAGALARRIRSVPLIATGVASIDRAISTSGGVAGREVNNQLMLAKKPGTFVAGEMLDWDAPTGGYLLQASFALGVAAAAGALQWLDAQPQNAAG